MSRSQLKWVVTLIILAFLIILPFITSGYTVRFLATVFMFSILAQAWNLFGGYTGYISFGHAAFFGVGAYVVAISMIKLTIPFYASLAMGALSSMLLAVVLAAGLFRMKGHYFVIGTIAMAEVIRECVNNLTSLTGGGMGLTLPIFPWDVENLNKIFYFLLLFIALASLITTALVVRSRFGYAFVAIRDEELSAGVAGINTPFYKTVSLALSAFFTGLAGGIFAYWMTYIEPSIVFDARFSVMMVIIPFLGGRGTILGPVLGAFVLEFLSEIVWAKCLTFHMGILGIVIVIVILFLPGGIIEILNRGWKGVSMKWLRENLNRYRI